MSKNTVTTPNWFQETFSKALGIGQENQFGSTRGLRYGPLRINKTGIFVNNGTLDSTIINSSGFHGYGLTGVEQLTLDANTGMNITDGVSSVFQAIISGTNVGDVVMGNYSEVGGKGAYFDKSAGTFTIKGTLSGVDGSFSGSISIGSGDNIFKADSNGIYLGNASFASAPFRVSMAGALTATNATISGAITATSGSFTGSITSTSGTIGGWTIGSSSLYSTDVTLSSASGGTILVGDSSSGISLLKSGGVPYIAFVLSSSVQALLRATTAGDGGINIVDGDLVIDNGKSVLLTSSGGYGALSMESSQQLWLTLGSGNTFYMKNFAQNDNYFTVSNDRAYHRAEFQANKITSNSGDLVLDPEGSNKVKLESNIDMNEKNIDGCDTVWAYNFSSRSDEVLKTNIKDTSFGLNVLKKLRPVSFEWKKKKGIMHYGLIAQEVEKILPDCISIDDQNVRGINYNEIIPIVIKAIQELDIKIKSL